MEYLLIKPRYYDSLFRDVVAFVVSPVGTEASGKTIRQRACDTIGLFVVKILLLIPISIVVGLIYDPENMTSKSLSERFSPVMLLLVGGVILPLLEEVGFRLSLRFKPIYLTVSSSVFLYYLLTKAVFQTKNSAIDESFPIRAGAAVALAVILFPILSVGVVRARLAEFWRVHFRLIYYASCVVFAGVHIFRYELDPVTVALLQVLCLPQLLSGIIYGYIRVAFGFWFPLGLHMSTNLIGIGLSFLPFADLLEF